MKRGRGPGRYALGAPRGNAALGALLALVCCTACGRYADFTLPPVSGGDPNMSFTFQALAQPVMTRGDGWDSRDVLNPSVVLNASGQPAPKGYPPGPRLLNFYSGFDGQTWRTGVAESDDGLHWRKQATLFEPDARTWEGGYIAANGSAVAYSGEYWYWYQAGPKDQPRIGLVRMKPNQPPRKEAGPVLDYGPHGSWDERAVADPDVIRIEPYFYMFYLGQDRARRQRLGVARSRDGLRWQKLRSNPVLELGGPGAFDENGLGEPAVWNSHGFYWMLYTGRDAAENRRLGLARSTDGVHWRKLSAVFEGTDEWDFKVVCDPSVVVSDAGIGVWFGGGSVASPDENLNGQIGFGVLRPGPAAEVR
ncbi:MAG: hypothetical protein LAQ30_09645 [Acidobacteriia bacterium]|nr:hypothetical protein [Terriglobia bacterium]